MLFSDVICGLKSDLLYIKVLTTNAFKVGYKGILISVIQW